jgi:trimethylamine:corrinoid methyltransferase-like protein
VQSLRPRINFLSGTLIERIVAEAKTVLRDLGTEIASPELSDLLLAAGARRSSGSGRILLGEDLIDGALETVPDAFTLHDRDGTSATRGWSISSTPSTTSPPPSFRET